MPGRFVPKTPWWAFWRRVCWRHLRLAPQESVCPTCLREDARKIVKKPLAGDPRRRGVVDWNDHKFDWEEYLGPTE